MPLQTQYLLVDRAVLPDTYIKVVRAKQLLAQGKAKSLSEAAKTVGLSRSAFYKYKDAVFTYEGVESRKIATLYAELVDEPGILSSLLAALSGSGANILTINQNIPVDGVAPVSVSMRIDSLRKDTAALVKDLQNLPGVVNVRLLSN